MKKILLCCLLVAATLLTAVGCDIEGGGQTEKTPATVFELWSAFANTKRDAITVEVTTKTEGVSLRANYSLKGETLTYSVDRVRTFSEEMDVDEIPTNFKETVTGTATVKDGVVTKIDDTTVTVPEGAALMGGYTITEGNLKNVTNENGKLSADVVSAKDFFGAEANVTDLHIELVYTKSAVVSLTVTYKTATAEVSSFYLFG